MPVSTVEPSDSCKVWDFKALQKSGSVEALALLHRIAKQVQPVIRKRGWRVPLLSEFSPKSPNLLGLNINGGGGRTSEIKIRLRPHNSESSFFPYEHLLGTMLHELVHNVQGPHNAVFYKLLDEITEECEGFMAKGISGTGAGFDAPSVGRLGGRGPVPIHNPPSHQLKSAALKAAEARAKKQSVMSSGPRTIGGDLSLLKSLTPAQAAARAAERRARDNVWCPCGDHGTGIGFSNNDGGVVILEDAQQSEQTSGIQAPFKPSSCSINVDDNDNDKHSMVPSCKIASTVAPLANQTQLGSDSSSASKTSQQRRQLGRQPTGNSLALPMSGKDWQQPQPVPARQQQAVSDGAGSNIHQRQCSSPELVDLTLNSDEWKAFQDPRSKRLKRQQHNGSHPTQMPTVNAVSVAVGHQQQPACSAPQWTCSVCTLLNESMVLQCSACDAIRPAGFS